MKIDKAIQKLDLEVVVEGDLEVEVTGGYACDLLSNVMAQAEEGDLWFTIQGHQNVVAVALLVEAAGVVVAEDFDIDDDTITRARENGINLLRSEEPIYQLAGKLYQLGIE